MLWCYAFPGSSVEYRSIFLSSLPSSYKFQTGGQVCFSWLRQKTDIVHGTVGLGVSDLLFFKLKIPNVAYWNRKTLNSGVFITKSSSSGN